MTSFIDLVSCQIFIFLSVQFYVFVLQHYFSLCEYNTKIAEPYWSAAKQSQTLTFLRLYVSFLDFMSFFATLYLIVCFLLQNLIQKSQSFSHKQHSSSLSQAESNVVISSSKLQQASSKQTAASVSASAASKPASTASKPNAASLSSTSSTQTSMSTTGKSSGMPSETDILNAR